MSHIHAIFSSPLANDETACDQLETDGSSQTCAKKKRADSEESALSLGRVIVEL
jgi:hypothetical protein